MNANLKDLVVIDVETSGVNPFRHEILSVGLVPMDIGLPTAVVHIRPDTIQWSEFARKNFEQFSAEWYAQAISPIKACEAIEEFLNRTFPGRSATPVGHNIGFDLGFLKKLAFLGDRDEIAGLSHRAIDTHTLLHLLFLQGKIPKQATSSDGAFDYFGIQIEKSRRHTALGDAMATRELFRLVLEKF